MAILKGKISKLYSDLDLEFTRNPVTNDVSKKTDTAAVKQALRILILSNFYERPFAHKKAGNLRGYLFQPIDILAAQSIKKNLENLITTYDKRIRIVDIEVPLAGGNIDRNVLSITLSYYVVGIPTKQGLTLNLERLR